MRTFLRLTHLLHKRATVVVALLAAMAGGCGGAATGATSGRAPASGQRVSLLAPKFRFRAAIYHREAPRTDAAAAALRPLAEASGFAVTGPGGEPSGAADRTRVRFAQPPIAEFAAPSGDSLEYYGRGLSPEDERAVPASRAVTVLEFVGSAASAHDEYRKALSIVRDLARELGGYIWDEEARNVFTLESFGLRVGAFANGVPVVPKHVTLHLYRDGELLRIVSLGMVKFGLPDVAVEEVAGNYSTSMSSLVNVICQTLVERPELDPNGTLHLALDALENADVKRTFSSTFLDNAQRKLDVTLVPVAPEEGDADNRLLELVFPGDDRERQQRHSAALSTFFGSTDAITHVEHDETLLAASARAKKKAFALRERFADGAPLKEMLHIKAPFATPSGSQEWMWVEVVSWKGDLIRGILDNDPFEIPTLKAGARVDVRADEIFDYIWTKPDGTTEGNDTSAILETMQRK